MYAYGRRPPTNKPALRFAEIRRTGTAAPAHPKSEDYLRKLRNWQMLGNDAIGDCNAVTWANSRRLVTAELARAEAYPSLDQVLAFYRTQNPLFDPASRTHGPGSSADQGMSIQDGLNDLHQHGGPDGVKAVAFAKVNPQDRDEVEAALAIFGFLWIGIYVQQANLEQFQRGVAWSHVPGSPINGGHAVLVGGYSPRRRRFVTWADETAFADSFWYGSEGGDPLVEEAWIVVWPEHLGSQGFQRGVDAAALTAAYQQLTGRSLSWQ